MAMHLSVRQVAEKLRKSISSGYSHAAKILQDYIARGGDIVSLRAEAGLSRHTWLVLDDIRTGRIWPEIARVGVRIYSSLRLLNPDQQRQLFVHGANVWFRTGARRIPLSQLNPASIDQVFGFGTVRTLEEQRQYLRDKEAKPKPEPKRLKHTGTETVADKHGHRVCRVYFSNNTYWDCSMGMLATMDKAYNEASR